MHIIKYKKILIGIIVICIASAIFFVVIPFIKHWNFLRFLQKIQQNHLPNAMLTVEARYEGKKTSFLEYQNHKRIHPGSNFKLFTAAASLKYLGPDFVFKTRLYLFSAAGRTHVLIQGSGDPSFSKNDVLAMVAAVKNHGKISGNLYYDDRVFRGEPFGPSWGHDWKDQYFAVPIFGLQMNDNLLSIQKKGGKFLTAPQENYPLQDSIQYFRKALPERSFMPITATMDQSGNVMLHGETLIDEDFVTSSTVANPSFFTARVFKQELVKAGVLAGRARVLPAPAKIPHATLLFEHVSAPLREIIKIMLTFSKNNYAESLVRMMGHEIQGEGSQKKGVSVLNDFFEEAKIVPQEMSAFDGSGLSPGTRVSSNALVRLFEYIKVQPWKNIFWEALPESQVDGTLRMRFSNAGLQHPVIAKTGTHEFSSSLSGRIVREGSRDILFSIHVYNHPYPTELVAQKIHPLIDRIVALLDEQF